MTPAAHFMADETAVATEALNQLQTDATAVKQEQKVSSTDEASLAGKQAGDVVKQEDENKPDYFDAEIERLNKLALHQKEVLSHKERALQAEKERRKKAEKLVTSQSNDESLVGDESLGKTRDELLEHIEDLRRGQEELRQSLLHKTSDDAIDKITSDNKEREAMRLALKAYGLNSGNSELDAYAARAIVNAGKFFEAGKAAAQQEMQEGLMTKFSSSGTAAPKAGETAVPNPMAAELLKRIGRADAIKYL